MNFSNYLPTKEYRKKLLSLFYIVAILLGVYLLWIGINKLIDKQKFKNQVKNLTVEVRDEIDTITLGELQTKDSNNNGVYDWEERLYGLDPLVNGEENKKLVEEKREILRKSGEGTSFNNQDSSTSSFASEFLGAITSLATTGALNEDTLSNISNSISTKFTTQTTDGFYKREDLNIVKDNAITKQNYLILSQKALETGGVQDALGEEIYFISNSLENNDPVMLAPLDNIASAYKEFGEMLVKVPVPETFAKDHAVIVNSSRYISEALLKIQKLYADPVIAIDGFAEYNTHYILLNRALDNLSIGYGL